MAYEIDYRDLDEEKRIAGKIAAWRAQPVSARAKTARVQALHAAAHDTSDPFAAVRRYCHTMAGLHIGNRGQNH